MKVTLIQPKYFNIWEALGLGYIGAYAKKHFAGKLDLTFFQAYFDADAQIIDDAKTSDIVAFSCTTPVFKEAVALASRIKQANPGARVVFGGVHPSAVPEQCLLENPVDQVVTGEGEIAFLKILSGETAPIVQGEPLTDFDGLIPDRQLIKNRRTVDLCQQMIEKRITSFQSVRVCPFHCAFCAERATTGLFHKQKNPIRTRDPEGLLDEIVQVSKDFELDYFKFVDATWNTSTEKVIAFCEAKLKRRFFLPWEANVHASFVSREMLEAMKAADCHQINVGCESGSQRILHDIGKGLTIDKIRSVFKWGKQLGIERRAFFLLGMPNETMADVEMTEALVDEIRPDVFGVTILCPYPGSDLYDPVTMKAWDWSFTDEYSNPYWETKNFTNSELKECQKYMTDKFSDSLAWHHRILDKQVTDDNAA